MNLRIHRLAVAEIDHEVESICGGLRPAIEPGPAMAEAPRAGSRETGLQFPATGLRQALRRAARGTRRILEAPPRHCPSARAAASGADTPFRETARARLAPWHTESTAPPRHWPH